MTRTASSGNPKDRGQLAPHAERPLRAGPDGQLAVLPLGHGRAGLERGMGDVGDGVGLLEADVRRLQALRDRAGPTVRSAEAAASARRARPGLAVRAASAPVKRSLLEIGGPGFHSALIAARAVDGQELARRGHADEVAVADDDHVAASPWPRRRRARSASR